MAILGGMPGGAASVSTLGGRAGVCTGDGGGTGGVGRWASTLGSAGGFSLGEGCVLCSGVAYGRGVGLDRNMLRMWVRDSKRLL